MEINIPWSTPEIKDEELKEVLDSFTADWLTMGPKVRRFEELMANYLNVPYAIAVSNGSVAIDLVLKVLGIKPGDEVIVPSMTYIATAAAVSYQSAVPVFVDIENQTFNLDASKIQRAIGTKTKAILFIDYGGNPSDIDALTKVAKDNQLMLIQDAAQSLGGKYQGKPLGAQTVVSTMSFQMAKVMTTVEGGMVLTHDERIATELRIRRNQGESGKYLHAYLGTNARMTDLNAAIGLAQFKKLPSLLEERARVAARYDRHFSVNPSIRTVKTSRPDSRNAYFFYPILVKNRCKVVDALKSKGIDTRTAYPMPVYQQEVYLTGREACRVTESPVAVEFTSKVINLPIFSSLSDDQIDYIAEAVIGAAGE